MGGQKPVSRALEGTTSCEGTRRAEKGAFNGTAGFKSCRNWSRTLQSEEKAADQTSEKKIKIDMDDGFKKLTREQINEEPCKDRRTTHQGVLRGNR